LGRVAAGETGCGGGEEIWTSGGQVQVGKGEDRVVKAGGKYQKRQKQQRAGRLWLAGPGHAA
jgi:hypothetical protein